MMLPLHFSNEAKAKRYLGVLYFEIPFLLTFTIGIYTQDKDTRFAKTAEECATSFNTIFTLWVTCRIFDEIRTRW